jgi:hypothetical protein
MHKKTRSKSSWKNEGGEDSINEKLYDTHTIL